MQSHRSSFSTQYSENPGPSTVPVLSCQQGNGLAKIEHVSSINWFLHSTVPPVTGPIINDNNFTYNSPNPREIEANSLDNRSLTDNRLSATHSSINTFFNTRPSLVQQLPDIRVNGNESTNEAIQRPQSCNPDLINNFTPNNQPNFTITSSSYTPRSDPIMSADTSSMLFNAPYSFPSTSQPSINLDLLEKPVSPLPTLPEDFLIKMDPSLSSDLTSTSHSSSQMVVRPYQCDQCFKYYSTVKSLKNHKLTHSSIRPHKCQMCGRAFLRSDKLRLHEMSHLNLKPFECPTCKQRFTRSDKLKIHDRIHTGVRPYPCTFCPKRFTRSDKLKIHERIHTNIKPYVCTFCGKCFARSDKRRLHENIHIYGPKQKSPSKKQKSSDPTSNSTTRYAVDPSSLSHLVASSLTGITNPFLPFDQISSTFNSPFNGLPVQCPTTSLYTVGHKYQPFLFPPLPNATSAPAPIDQLSNHHQSTLDSLSGLHHPGLFTASTNGGGSYPMLSPPFYPPPIGHSTFVSPQLPSVRAQSSVDIANAVSSASTHASRSPKSRTTNRVKNKTPSKLPGHVVPDPDTASTLMHNPNSLAAMAAVLGRQFSQDRLCSPVKLKSTFPTSSSSTANAVATLPFPGIYHQPVPQTTFHNAKFVSSSPPNQALFQNSINSQPSSHSYQQQHMSIAQQHNATSSSFSNLLSPAHHPMAVVISTSSSNSSQQQKAMPKCSSSPPQHELNYSSRQYDLPNASSSSFNIAGGGTATNDNLIARVVHPSNSIKVNDTNPQASASSFPVLLVSSNNE